MNIDGTGRAHGVSLFPRLNEMRVIHCCPLACLLMPSLHLHQSPNQAKDEVHRAQLSSFGIPADLAVQPMYTLSGAAANA